MAVKDIIRETEEKMKKALEAMQREFAEISTGRANPNMVEGLRVDCYGSPMLLKQLASVTAPDARSLLIQPWDASIISDIEKAILKSNLGVNPVNDSKVIRLSIPQLSKERRQELAKVVKNLAEDGRISLRTIRRDAKEAIDRLEKNKLIPEDEKFKGHDSLQKTMDSYIQKVDQALTVKEKELAEF
jgi:ribosome recycling factor